MKLGGRQQDRSKNTVTAGIVLHEDGVEVGAGGGWGRLGWRVGGSGQGGHALRLGLSDAPEGDFGQRVTF